MLGPSSVKKKMGARLLERKGTARSPKVDKRAFSISGGKNMQSYFKEGEREGRGITLNIESQWEGGPIKNAR